MSEFAARAVFPQEQPTVCVTFFTCVGTNVTGTTDLEHAYPAAVRYLEMQEMSEGPLRYELAWLDNGGDGPSRRRFIERGVQVEHLITNPTNEGLFRAVNDVSIPETCLPKRPCSAHNQPAAAAAAAAMKRVRGQANRHEA